MKRAASLKALINISLLFIFLGISTSLQACLPCTKKPSSQELLTRYFIKNCVFTPEENDSTLCKGIYFKADFEISKVMSHFSNGAVIKQALKNAALHFKFLNIVSEAEQALMDGVFRGLLATPGIKSVDSSDILG